MASKVAQKRLQKEYMTMQKSPPPFIWACPEEKNILDWHFIIRGPPDTPYAGGEYHGLIWFPSDYPFKPPDVKMFTPSGRFEVGHKICMSMTSYHPSTWNAAWSVATILTGLLSFMLSDEITAGAVKTTDQQKRELAKQSHQFNLNNKKFREIFPEYATPEMKDLPDMGITPSASSSQSTKGMTLSVSSSTTPNASTSPTPSPSPSDISRAETPLIPGSITTVAPSTTSQDGLQVPAQPPKRVVAAAGDGSGDGIPRSNMSYWRWLILTLFLALIIPVIYPRLKK